jgi:hypothetical protein
MRLFCWGVLVSALYLGYESLTFVLWSHNPIFLLISFPLTFDFGILPIISASTFSDSITNVTLPAKLSYYSNSSLVIVVDYVIFIFYFFGTWIM